MALNERDREMMLIKSLDPSAHLEFSEYTFKWYVEAKISVGGDGVLVGGTEHCDSPEDAINAYLAYLITIDLDHYLCTNINGTGRRHWRWNGVAFAEVPFSYKEG